MYGFLSEGLTEEGRDVVEHIVSVDVGQDLGELVQVGFLERSLLPVVDEHARGRGSRVGIGHQLLGEVGRIDEPLPVATLAMFAGQHLAGVEASPQHGHGLGAQAPHGGTAQFEHLFASRKVRDPTLTAAFLQLHTLQFGLFIF